MQSFSITKRISIICDTKNTRNGFKHTATLMIDGFYADQTKVCYLNRTWESYQYETVLRKLITKTKQLNANKKARALRFVKNYQPGNPFKSVAMVAKLGDVLCNTEQEKNIWKLRMLKAGLGNSGLIVPEDFGALPEEEKTKRLDGAISAISQ